MTARKAKAVVCRETGRVQVEEVRVEAPARDEVMIRIAACGVCHSDLSATDGTIRMPLPLVLGHEASGTVVAVGDGVTGLAVDDHVVSSFVSMCGKCRFCVTGRPQLCEVGARAVYRLPDGSTRVADAHGNPLNVFSACGVLAEYATLHVNNVVRIDPEMPLEPAALISCGVMTGVGAVINTARVPPGASVLVVGAGGVGLNAIQGAALAGAATIIAADVSDAKLELARQFGATATVNPASDEAWVKTVKKMTGGGPDFCFECVGRGALVEAAFRASGRGGTTVVVGVAKAEDTTPVRTAAVTFEEKSLVGSYFGSARPSVDFPRLIAMYRAGRLKLDELITRRYAIEQAPQAFEDLAAGRNARGVIVF